MSTLADVDAALVLRDWLRSQSELTALVPAARINAFGRVQQDPQIVINQVGGGDPLGTTPEQVVLLSVDVWGSTAQGYNATASIKGLVRALLRNLRRAAVGAHGRIDGATCLGDLHSPDPTTGQARFVLTYQTTVRSV